MPHKPRNRPVTKSRAAFGKKQALIRRNPKAAGRGLKGLTRPRKK